MISACPYIDYPVLQVRPNTLLVYSRREWSPAILAASKLKKVKEARAVKKSNPALPDLFRAPISVSYQLPLMAVSNKQVQDAHSLRENFRGRKTYSGQITEHSRKRLRRSINLLIAQAKWKTAIDYKSGKEYKFLINFITLTLPTPQGNHTDKDIKKKVLDPWIKKAKRRFNLKSYVWRAERQGNGNIHFHIASDIFMDYKILRDTWNENLEALGFISEYEKKHKHRHPNSTDVHAVKNINNIAGYILKYMTKEVATEKDLTVIRGGMFSHGTGPRLRSAKMLAKIVNLSDVPLSGKVWDCSANLKLKQNCELFLESDTERIWTEERQLNQTRVTDSDRFSYITYKRSDFNRMLRGPLKTHWNNYLKVIRDHVPREKKIIGQQNRNKPIEVQCPF